MTIANAAPNAFTQITTMAQWENLMLSMGITDGVAGDTSTTDLKVSLNTGARTAVAAAGNAVIRGQLWGTDAPVSTAIPAASGQNRIDRLVLRLDRQGTTGATVVQPVVIAGTPSATPTPPAILNTTRFCDLLLGQWQSSSDGSLVSLLDYRRFSGNPVAIINSGTRPTPTRPTLAYEVDTAKVVLWNGSSWSYYNPVEADTGWVTLAVNGPQAAAWNADAVCRIRKIGNTVHMRLALQRVGSTLGTSDSNGSTPLVVPTGYRPTVAEFGSGWGGFNVPPVLSVAVFVDTDGSVILYANEAVAAGKIVNATVRWFVT